MGVRARARPGGERVWGGGRGARPGTVGRDGEGEVVTDRTSVEIVTTRASRGRRNGRWRGRAFFLGRIDGARRARGSRVEPLDARWARASGLISAWRSVNVVADASRSMTSPRVRRRHVARSDARDRGGDAGDVDAWIGRRGANPRRGSPRTRSHQARTRDPRLLGAARRSTRAPARRSRIAPRILPRPVPRRGRAHPRRARAGRLTLDAELTSPLPTTRRLDDAPARAAAPCLRRDGVVVQLRFVAVPAPVHPHAPTRSGPLTDVENDTEVSPDRSSPSNAIAYRILDAAFTADHLSTRGRAILPPWATSPPSPRATRSSSHPPRLARVDPPRRGNLARSSQTLPGTIRNSRGNSPTTREGKTMRGAAPRHSTRHARA